MSALDLIAVIAIVAGVAVIGGGLWLGLALVSPAWSQRVFGPDAPPRFADPQRRQAAYIREGSLAFYLVVSGPMLLFFGLVTLQDAPFAIVPTVFWPLVLLGLACAIVRRSMTRVIRKR